MYDEYHLVCDHCIYFSAERFDTPKEAGDALWTHIDTTIDEIFKYYIFLDTDNMFAPEVAAAFTNKLGHSHETKAERSYIVLLDGGMGGLLAWDSKQLEAPKNWKYLCKSILSFKSSSVKLGVALFIPIERG